MSILVSDWWCAKHKVLVLEKREKPPFAEKYGWEWDDDINHWVSPEKHEDNLNIKYDIKNDTLEEASKDTLPVGGRVAIVDFSHDKRMEVGKVLKVNVSSVVVQFNDGSIEELSFEQIRGIHIKGTKKIPEGYLPVDDNQLELGDKVFIPTENEFGMVSNFYNDGRIQVNSYRWNPTELYYKPRVQEQIGEFSRSGPGFSNTGFDRHKLSEYTNLADNFESQIKDHPSYVRISEIMGMGNYITTGFEFINKSLLHGHVPKEAKTISKEMKFMKNPFPLYRATGLSLDRFNNDKFMPAQVGDVISLKSFSSTSRKPLFSWGFRGGQDVFLEIETTSDTRAISLANSETPTPEYETVLDYGQQIEILSIEQVESGFTDKNGNPGMRPVIKCRIISPSQNIQKMIIVEKREKPEFAKKYGLEFNEQKHRWVQPNTGEVYEHPENDSRWKYSDRINPLSIKDYDLENLKYQYHEVKEFEKIIINHPNAISELTSALTYYLGSSHEEINRKLRTGTITEDALEIKNQMKFVEKPYTVYRSTGLIPEFFYNDEYKPSKIGDEITLKSFTSTSRNLDFAWLWEGGFSKDPNVLLEIDLTPDTQAITIPNRVSGRGEFETLIDYGQKIKIIDVEYREISGFTRPVYKCQIVSVDPLILQKEMRETPEFARKYGLEFDEDKHRWVHPDTGEEYHHETGELEVSGHDSRSWKDTSKLEDKLENHPNYVRYQDYRDVLDKYVGTPDSWEMNKDIAQGILSDDAKNIKTLMKPMKEPFTIYRGITLKTGKFFNDNGEEAKIGDRLSLKAFTSCTRNPRWAKHFPVKNQPHTVESKSAISADKPLFAKLTIQTTPDTYGISISAYDLKTGEYETILDYGQQLEILRFETEDNGVWLNVRCRIVSNNNLELQKAIRQKPQWAQEHNLEFNEDHHRWMKPDTNEPFDHPENDGRHRFEIGQEVISILGNRDVPSKILEFKDNGALVQVKDSYDKWTVSYDKISEKGRKKDTQVNVKKLDNIIKEDRATIQDVMKNSDLFNYVGVSSGPINQSVLDGKPNQEAQKIKQLMKPLDRNLSLYRGIVANLDEVWGVEGPIKKGSIIPILTFASTSRDKKVGLEAVDDGGILFELESNKDTLGLNLLSDEYETLLDYGQNIEVTKIKKIKHPRSRLDVYVVSGKMR